jgi:hypothetical protein
MLIQPIDYFLLVWFALALASTAYVAWDQYANNPEPVVMKWGFILVTLYLGVFGLLIYVLTDKEPRPGTHEEFIKPLWKQGVGSTIHCVAGDATGIIIAAVIVALLGLPMWLDLIIEYVAGFAVGLFIFQSLFMKNMMGGTYWENVRKSFLPEFVSMNFMMAGMAPVMSFLMMGRDMRAMEPTELLFWGVMSLGVMAGFALAFPANVWMVARRLKHGLMTDRSALPQTKQTAHKHKEPASEHQNVEHRRDREAAHGEMRDHGQHERASDTSPGGEGHDHAQHRHASEAQANAQPSTAGDKRHTQHEGHDQHALPGSHAHEEESADHGHAHGPSGIPVVAKIGRHPLHPMLVTLPIGIFVAALISDLGHWVTGSRPGLQQAFGLSAPAFSAASSPRSPG